MNLHFDLVDIRLFVAIAKSGSLSKAAEERNISTSAASVRLKNMENSIGTKFFIREPNGVVLTPIGKQFLIHASELLHHADKVQTQMKAYIYGVKGDLRVLMNTTALSGISPLLINQFLVENPDVNLELEEHLSAKIVEIITENKADFGVISDTIHIGNLVKIPYKTDRLVIIASSRHAISNRCNIKIQELVDFDFISLTHTSALSIYIRTIMGLSNVVLKNRVSVGNFDSIADLVHGNIGLAIIPDSLSKKYQERYEIKRIVLNEHWAQRDMVICCKSYELLSPHAKKFINLLTDNIHNTNLIL